MISILKQFKQLKRLDLNLYFKDFEESFVEFHPFEELKGLNGLTHLSIDIWEPSHNDFNETILTDIDINLPKLKYLEIECLFIASEWTPQVLSRLSSLETIALRIRNREIGPQIERQLIKNCKHFKKITYFG